MSAIQTSRSPDIARLEAEGYRLQIIQGASGANHLVVEEVPAVNSKKKVVRGKLYCPLEVGSDGVTGPPSSHQCWWIGEEAPCDATGRVMQELISDPTRRDMGDGIVTVAAMSRKKRIGGEWQAYADYYEKITTYVPLIWGPATRIDPTCTPRVNGPMAAVVTALESVFHYPDMATTRAGIGAATAKLLVEKVAIIGLGGTGSYILDLVAKTPVAAIHIFDGDDFEIHNAFRGPGAPNKSQLAGLKKVDRFGDIYDNMRQWIVRHPYHVRKEQLAELDGCSFVFISIDDPEAKKIIIDYLIANRIAFLDVGMDLSLDKENCLRGQCRVTLGLPGATDHIGQTISFEQGPENDLYKNIQVADMNMYNAAQAVIKWKKTLGFYADDPKERHTLYIIQTNGLIKKFIP